MALKRNRRPGDIFNMSFLDIICCGFGAMVLLVLLSNTDVLSGALTAERVRGMLGDISAAQEMRDEAQTRRDELQTAREKLESELRALAKAPADTLPELQAQLAEMRARKNSLQREVNASPAAEAKVESVDAKNVGGIAVDSEHIIFIVDTSGSMRDIWERVIAQLENILDIHPQVKGFQIMNTDGKYLWSAYSGKWMTDTPSRRKSALSLMRNWLSGSASSPVQGLRVALRTYARTESLAIYVFGDDFGGGGGFDAVVEELSGMNRGENGEPRARIHGIGFLPVDGSVNANRFATLMRELARRNRGAFVGLALEHRAALSAGGYRAGD